MVVNEQSGNIKYIVVAADKQLRLPIPNKISSSCVGLPKPAVGEATAIGLSSQNVGYLKSL